MTGAAGDGERGKGPIRVLFLCSHNSARSIFAEALLRRIGGREFEAHSAGVEATGIRPLTLRVLEESGVPTEGLHSKSLEQFHGQPFDYAVTVCEPARQACPVFPGARRMLHWDFEDPSAAVGSEEEQLAVYRRVFAGIEGRVNALVAALREERVEQPVP
ncbi:MAG: arsenate reductase ArsC [Chloroflexota bacterium]|nr:arsenate reductase ArsC [Chloroflexota bacterium]